MIKLLSKVPHNVEIAVSGGVDSMAAESFLTQMRVRSRPLFFNHGTETSIEAEKFLKAKFGEALIVGAISGSRPKGESWEEYWRNERNKFFKSREEFIVTAHHLNDAVETWIWGSLHGQPKLINYFNGIVHRPFLLTPKAELIGWAKRHNIEWIEDKSNADNNFQRNYVRNVLMPHALHINKGLENMLRKKLLKKYSSIKESNNVL